MKKDSKRGSVHQKIKACLIERMAEMPLESQLPSDRDLSEEFGVAFLTINKVMRELESEGYVERRARRGTFLASRERTIFRDSSTGTAGGSTVIFAYPNYFSYSYWVRVSYAEAFTLKNGLNMIEFKMNPDTSYEKLFDLAAHRKDIMGMALLPVPGNLSSKTVKKLDGLGMPVVILEPNEFSGGYNNVYTICPDWIKSGYLKASALLSAGHAAIGYICNEPESPERVRVIKGMKQALRDAGVPVRSLEIFGKGSKAWRDSRESSIEFTSQALDAGKTGLVFDSINGAKGALYVAHKRGLRVPEDVSMVSGGNCGYDAEYMLPPMTTVDYDMKEEVRLALETITNPTLKHPPVRNIDVSLTERGSISHL